MQLPTQLVKLGFELRSIERQFFGQAEEGEIICAGRQRLNLAASGAEMGSGDCSLAIPALRAGRVASFVALCLRDTHIVISRWTQLGTDGPKGAANRRAERTRPI